MNRAAVSLIAIAANQPMPEMARIFGIASLVIWIAVAICGRSIAYF
jgi:hypothetical protein